MKDQRQKKSLVGEYAEAAIIALVLSIRWNRLGKMLG